jgi:hypothetical protein
VAIKEVKLLGEHEMESSQKITELEALCKRLREDAHKLKEEKTTLEGMTTCCRAEGDRRRRSPRGDGFRARGPVAHEVILADTEPEMPQPGSSP